MKKVLGQRGLRFVFIANLVSMMGSGMNNAAVIWSILQTTHSELSLGYLVTLQTIPAVLLMPFSGVIIDREDRRHLVMLLDASRGILVFVIACLALTHHVHLWHLYIMNILVSMGFWMFWPAINALIQELSPEDEILGSNSLLMAGIQGGWLIAGALVGFIYNKVGLGGVLLIDFSTYVVSFLCYLGVRKGRHVVQREEVELPAVKIEGSAFGRYFHEMREGWEFVRGNRPVMLIGVAWSLTIAAMLTQGVTTAPISDRILHKGAVGYGSLNLAWAAGAFLSVFYAARVVNGLGALRTAALCMGVLAIFSFASPLSTWLLLTMAIFLAMGSGRGLGGIAVTTGLMERVPQHFMGRVQNTFYFLGMLLQIITSLIVGAIAHRVSLTLGIMIIGGLYGLAAIAALSPSGEMETQKAAIAAD